MTLAGDDHSQPTSSPLFRSKLKHLGRFCTGRVCLLRSVARFSDCVHWFDECFMSPETMILRQQPCDTLPSVNCERKMISSQIPPSALAISLTSHVKYSSYVQYFSTDRAGSLTRTLQAISRNTPPRQQENAIYLVLLVVTAK